METGVSDPTAANATDNESVNNNDGVQAENVNDAGANNIDQAALEKGDAGHAGIFEAFSQMIDTIGSFFKGFWT